MTKVSGVIRSVDGVQDIEEVVPDDEPGVCTYTVRVAEESIRKPLVAALVAADCMVLEISVKRSSLEDVFVRLTSSSSASGEADELAEIRRELDAERRAAKDRKEDGN